MVKIISIIFFAFLSSLTSFGQTYPANNAHQDSTQKYEQLQQIRLREVEVHPKNSRKRRKQEKRYERLVRRVKKVYPYSKMAAAKLEEYNDVYVTLESERARRRYIKKVEKDLFSEFEGSIRNMSISEGRILIKLIDREVGMSSFEIIKEFRGGFTAFFWQAVARLFSNNLKSKYDPYGEDWEIEYIVTQIEMGLI